MLSKMNVFLWLFIASQFPFDFIVRNIMLEQNGKGYQEINTIEAFGVRKYKK